MHSVRSDNEEQATYWNGAGGQAWSELQQTLDDVLRPFVEPLLQDLPFDGTLNVLDVGCGAGATTIAAAQRLGPAGCAVGIDLSEPLIVAARTAGRSVDRARFLCADASAYAFEPGAFDLLISRFGVMFFDDPVAAFANLRAATRSGGLLRFIAWRTPAENSFMTAAERAARPLLPALPDRTPDAPGQFAFGDARRIASILVRSGWRDVAIEPFDVVCAFSKRELTRYFTMMGPLGRLLHDMNDRARREIVATVRAAFEPYVFGPDVRFSAACWIVSATAGGRHDATP